MVFSHATTPRVQPVDDPSPEVAQQLSQTLGDDTGTPLTIFRTLAQHPRLLKRFNVLGGFFLTRGTLPARDREIAVLRTAWRCACAYEWGQHVLIGRDAGLSDTDIAAIAGPDRGQHLPDAGALLRAVDELLDHDDLSDASWQALTEHRPTDQVLELVVLVGFYRMTAGFLNTTGVQPEPHLPGWPTAASPTPTRTPEHR